ncbi:MULTISPECIES: DUF2306 domain-containing protein [Actinoplanes]|uniref:DUF2306 domain-containing protein n=1 Tax=Actinoplanes TaxID=1865 RepID=UPI0005F2F497|nr:MULTISPECIES: DUF2306 domain-containing protein [Actinoplanes]GLY06468.1 hypothetical protein Acsp01_68470 [Actinoplanes sp. NBRC 101535]
MQRQPAWLMFVVAVAVAAVLSVPYLSLDIGDSRIAVRDDVHYYTLVAHVITASVALIIGPLQFVDRVRARRRLHRVIGRTYLIVGVVAFGVTGIPVALWSGRPLTQVSLTLASLLWLVTGVLAYRSARRRQFLEHREWVMRNYALTFLAVTARIVVPLLLLSQVPFGRVAPDSIGDRAVSMIPLGQTLGWIVNLILAEVLISRSRRRRRPALVADRPGRPE